MKSEIEKLTRLLAKQDAERRGISEDEYWNRHLTQYGRNDYLSRAQEILMHLYPERNLAQNGVTLTVWTPTGVMKESLAEVKVEQFDDDGERVWQLSADESGHEYFATGIQFDAVMLQLIDQKLARRNS
ncbi:hypothetical protein AB0K16_21985 [Nonomuraea jabiensis]|uniref:hypothetical protein n=1 Tax=Nonomuraea jabiensis TaxID=882448 RepID=UPI003417B3D7